MIPQFTHYAAVDWSGAAGTRHKGIAVAICAAGAQAPRLVRPHHRWSRAEVLDWLINDTPEATLIGFDMGVSFAFADAGAFFPGWSRSPADARQLWALVEEICAEEADLAATRFADHPDIAPHFRRPRQPGDKRSRLGTRYHLDNAPDKRGRLRVTERAQQTAKARPTSNFNLVGAGQVGKGSLAGMRLLHRLPRDIAVWPVDPLPATGKIVLEIYTALAAMAAGRGAGATKIRSHGELNAALAVLGSDPAPGTGPIPDHASDALVTAAWLRAHAARAELWHPPALTPQLARTEGWTFGAP